MAYWIGVVGSRQGIERLRSNDETWWCLSKNALPGDILGIYLARNRIPELPVEQAGVLWIFEVLGSDPEHTGDCRRFGGSAFGSDAPLPVKIKVKQRYKLAVRLSDMKRDKILASAKFVRRSFQGTYFEASRAEFNRIEKLLNVKTASK